MSPCNFSRLANERARAPDGGVGGGEAGAVLAAAGDVAADGGAPEDGRGGGGAPMCTGGRMRQTVAMQVLH